MKKEKKNYFFLLNRVIVFVLDLKERKILSAFIMTMREVER